MPTTPDTSLVDTRGRKYLTRDERERFLAAVRTHPKPPVQTPRSAARSRQIPPSPQRDAIGLRLARFANADP